MRAAGQARRRAAAGRDHEAINDLHAEANTLRARLDELADMLGDGEVTRQQYARQRERIEGKIDPDEQSPPRAV